MNKKDFIKKTRGQRNNNPLNIVMIPDNNPCWLGAVPYRRNTDGKFEQFEKLDYGVRAAFKILHRYITFYHCNTVSSIVSRWCPDFTAPSYIENVTRLCNLTPKTLIDSKTKLFKLIRAMARVESCMDLPLSLLLDVYSTFGFSKLFNFNCDEV